MISYKRDVLERQSLLEVKMGRGSPICERVRKKIVEYFKNNVPQFAKALQISSSTVVVGRARLRETLKQSKQMCRGFETFRHPSLRWHLVVIFKYCSETASTKKQLSELTNYNVCCVNRSTKWFGGVVSVLDWNAVSLGSNPGWSSHLHKIIMNN